MDENTLLKCIADITKITNSSPPQKPAFTHIRHKRKPIKNINRRSIYLDDDQEAYSSTESNQSTPSINFKYNSFQEVTAQVRSVNGGCYDDDLFLSRVKERSRQKQEDALNYRTPLNESAVEDESDSDILNKTQNLETSESIVELDTSDKVRKAEKKYKKIEKTLSGLSKDMEYHKNNALMMGLCMKKMSQLKMGEIDVSSSSQKSEESSSDNKNLTLEDCSEHEDTANEEVSIDVSKKKVTENVAKNGAKKKVNVVQSAEDGDFFLNPLQVPGYTDSQDIDFTLPRKGTQKIYTHREHLMNLDDDFFTFTMP